MRIDFITKNLKLLIMNLWKFYNISFSNVNKFNIKKYLINFN